MFDILYLLTQTKPIDILTPSVAQAYYEVYEEPVVEVDPSTTIEGNCYLYVAQFVKLPRMAQILPSTSPFIGAVAIFQYKDKHLALVDLLTEEGFWVNECNYTAGVCGRRFVKWNDPKLVGFYSPSTSPTSVLKDGTKGN